MKRRVEAIWSFCILVSAIAASGQIPANVSKVQVADGQAGADIGAQINAAFAACGGTAREPVQACVVQLQANKVYSYGNTIVIPNNSSAPYVYAPTLDCHGATLNYTGSGEALTVLGENGYKTGEIRNCTFNVGAAANTITFWSRIDFTVHHSQFSVGRSGINWINDLAHGGPGYFEDNHWSDIQINVPANACGIRFAQDSSMAGSGAGSFFYNFFEGFHFDLAGNNSNGFCTTTAKTGEPAVALFGGNYQVHVNSGGTGDAVFYVAPNSNITRGVVEITGENTGGGSPVYDVFAASASATFFNFGQSYATGFVHGYGGAGAAAAPAANVFFSGGPQWIHNDIVGGAYGLQNNTSETGGINAARICKTFNAGSAVFALANFDPGVDCFFEIGYRTTDNAGHPDVDVQGTSRNPFTSILWSDNFSKGVGVGAGYGTKSGQVLPTHTLEFNGTFGSKDGRLSYNPSRLNVLDGFSLASNALGINRDASSGTIFNAAGYGYQLAHTLSTTPGSDQIALQYYSPTGAFLGNIFVIAGDGSIAFGSGFTGTKTTGSCTFVIKGGIITNVTGC